MGSVRYKFQCVVVRNRVPAKLIAPADINVFGKYSASGCGDGGCGAAGPDRVC